MNLDKQCPNPHYMDANCTCEKQMPEELNTNNLNAQEPIESNEGVFVGSEPSLDVNDPDNAILIPGDGITISEELEELPINDPAEPEDGDANTDDEDSDKDQTGSGDYIDDIIDHEIEKTSTFTNRRQELFCQLYARHEEFFGNGTQSYIEAYNPKRKGNWYNSAMASASRLLRDVKILARINEILEETGFNDAFIDKQLSLLITQNADYKSKLGAIKEYNALKARVIKKIDLTSNGKGLQLTEEQRAVVSEAEEKLKLTFSTPSQPIQNDREPLNTNLDSTERHQDGDRG
jgi:hypothetical protein